MTLKTQVIKAKTEKWHYLKLKNFCPAKETIHRQTVEWKKIFANNISDKELISKLLIEHLQFKNKKPNNPIKKWSKDLNRHFSKGNM